MLNVNKNWEDFIIASGETHSLKELIVEIFFEAGLDAEKYIKIDENLLDQNELIYSKLNPNKIKSKLNWSAKCN